MAISSRAALSICLAAVTGWFAAMPAMAQSSRPGMGSIPYADAGGTGVTFRVWAPNATQRRRARARSIPAAGPLPTCIWSKKPAGLGFGPATTPTRETVTNTNISSATIFGKRDPRGRKVVNSSDNSIVYDPSAYAWGGDTRLPATNSDLVIYEMHIGAFYDPSPTSGGPGKFTDAMTKLDYLTTSASIALS